MVNPNAFDNDIQIHGKISGVMGGKAYKQKKAAQLSQPGRLWFDPWFIRT
jgi:hypothetical protein